MSIEINITNQKDLNIYMDAQRQRLLKIMEIQGKPMTPKQLSIALEISPSSATYHLMKLKKMGLVELDHTEIIHGIQAKFYKKVPAIVNLKGDINDELKNEKLLLAEYHINDIWTDFKHYISEMENTPNTNASPVSTTGDFWNGILYLTEEEARQLKELIQHFHENHLTATEDTKPWEMALIAFPRET